MKKISLMTVCLVLFVASGAWALDLTGTTWVGSRTAISPEGITTDLAVTMIITTQIGNLFSGTYQVGDVLDPFPLTGHISSDRKIKAHATYSNIDGSVTAPILLEGEVQGRTFKAVGHNLILGNTSYVTLTRQ